MKILNMVFPHSNVLLLSRLELGCCKPHEAAHHPTKVDVIYGVKLFLPQQYIAGYIVANL